MLRAIGRNGVLIGALIVGATVAGKAATLVVTPRGALGPLVLRAESRLEGLAAVAIALGVATALAILVGRVCNTAVGLFALGGGLFGLAWRLESVDELAHSGTPALAALETALWAALVLAATIAVFRLAGPLKDIGPEPGERAPHPLLSAEAFKSAAGGAVVLPIVWLVAQSSMKGQAIGAVFVGGIAAGLVGRLLAPRVQPVLLFASPVLFGALGHLIGMFVVQVPFAEAYVAGVIPSLNLPMPVDYATGSLMGVAVGLGWAKSFVHHDERDRERES